MTDAIRKAIEKVIAAIQADELNHGGLLSRTTIRAADELRVLLSKRDEA